MPLQTTHGGGSPGGLQLRAVLGVEHQVFAQLIGGSQGNITGPQLLPQHGFHHRRRVSLCQLIDLKRFHCLSPFHAVVSQPTSDGPFAQTSFEHQRLIQTIAEQT
ncbi:hypothetical protein D9M71_839900 [compost metagenome]